MYPAMTSPPPCSLSPRGEGADVPGDGQPTTSLPLPTGRGSRLPSPWEGEGPGVRGDHLPRLNNNLGNSRTSSLPSRSAAST